MRNAAAGEQEEEDVEEERRGQVKNLAIRAAHCVIIIPRVVNVIVRTQIASRAKQLIEA